MSPSGPEQSGSHMLCPTCGKLLPAGAKFCGFCGTALDAAPAAAAQPQNLALGGKVCPSCSTTYPAYALFCPKEGAQLVNTAEFSFAQAVGGGTGTTKPDYHIDTDSENVIPVTELIGQTIGGKYKIEDYLGEGGMAVVYRALHLAIERPVVIKVLQGRLVANEKSVQRFERECKVTAKVSHPNVVSVFDVGFINGTQPYLVMEYIKGESLRDKIDREGPMAPAVVAAILVQACRGLQEAHSMNIIHRDLKPENILLLERSDRPDWVKIVDFGIAHLASAGYQRLTKTGSVIGTAEYMAPEQLRDFPLDVRADLYAMGVLIFEMLTSRMPFEAETTEALLLKILMDEPQMPSQFRDDIEPGSAFDLMITKALQKDPNHRYQTATEMRIELEHLHQHLMLKRT